MRFPRTVKIALYLSLTTFVIGCRTIPQVERANRLLIVASEREWLAGDLHTHSTYSDGDSEISRVIQTAAERGLDFFVVTDHDTSMAGDPQHWFDDAYRSTDLTLLYGVEWTSGLGHAVILAGKPFDYSQLWMANRDRDPLAASAAGTAAGAIMSINHPTATSGGWQYPLVTQDEFLADALEVWNGPFVMPRPNGATIRRLWDPLLQQGYRVTGVGGSDSHELEGFERLFNLPGSPTTWVLADDESPSSILAAIRNGRVTIAYHPDGDRLELYADADSDGTFESMIGDEIRARDEIVFAAVLRLPDRDTSINADAPCRCNVFKNGKRFASFRVRCGQEQTITFTDSPQTGDYYRATLTGPLRIGVMQRLVGGRMRALTNPIYVN